MKKKDFGGNNFTTEEADNEIAAMTARERKKVGWLHLSGNQMRALPGRVLDFPNLHYLTLGCNMIRTLPAWTKQMTGLQVLHLNENGLRQIPEALKDCLELERLEVRENKITELPAWLGRLKKLQQLSASSNLLTDLPLETLRNMKELHSFDVRFNPELPLEENVEHSNPRLLDYLERFEAIREQPPLEEVDPVLQVPAIPSSAPPAVAREPLSYPPPQREVQPTLQDMLQRMEGLLLDLDNRVTALERKQVRVGTSKLSVPTFRVVVVGDSKSGKSALIKRYLTQQFEEKQYSPTKQHVEHHLQLSTSHGPVAFDLVEVGGWEKGTPLKELVHSADAAIFMFDVTSRPSYNGVTQYWKPEVAAELGNMVGVLLGNKCDLKDRQIKSKYASFQITSDMDYFDVSVKSQHQLMSPLEYLARKLTAQPDLVLLNTPPPPPSRRLLIVVLVVLLVLALLGTLKYLNKL